MSSNPRLRKKKQNTAPATTTQRKKRSQRAPQNLAAARSMVVGNPANKRDHRSGISKPNIDATQALSGTLTNTQSAIIEYLTGLSTPDFPTKVPVIIGQFELFTNTYNYSFDGVATAGAAGVAYVACCPDNWLQSGNNLGAPNDQFLSYSGGTQGFPVWASIANATTTPAVGAASGINDGKYAMVLLDPGHEAQTRARLTALILEVWSDAPYQTAQGDIAIAVVQNSEALNDQVLNTATFSSIVGLPQDFVRHNEFPLAGWKSGEVVSAHLTPWDEECFVMDSLPAVGRATTGFIGICAVATGMAAGQTFRYRATYKYETTMPKTYQTNLIVESSVGLNTSQLVPYLKPMREQGPTKGPKEHSRAKGPAGALVAGDRPMKQAIKKTVEAIEKGSTVGSALKSGAHSALSWIAGKVPYVGGLLQSGLDWLMG